MSANLFEIQRIWDAWPNVQNQQVFRDLFRQLSSPLMPSAEGSTEINGVFVIPGHVFIAASSSGWAKLHAFSCTLPQRDVKTRDDQEGTSLLELGGGCTKVVNVISMNQEGTNQQIYVVQDNGEVGVFEYSSEHHKWALLERLSLSNSTIHSCVLHSATSDFVFCEKIPHMQSEHSYQIVARRHRAVNNGSFALAAPRVILTHVPPLQPLSFQDGVCFYPCSVAYPSGLLLFWSCNESSQSDVVKPFIWNCGSMLNQYTVSNCEALSFRTLAQRLAGTLKKVVSDPCLVSVTVNPLTNQLLALAGDGTVYTLKAPLQGQVERVKLTKLSDFAHRWSSVAGLFSGPSQASSIHMFTLHTFLGLFIKGEIRIYDGFSGEFLWESDEHEGAGSALWTMSTIPSFCGIYDNSGVWLIKSRKATDQAYFMANALFPISTNADETTPGNYLDCGQVLAAKMCKLWGLKLLRVKYALEAGFEKVKGNTEEKQVSSATTSLPHLSPHLLLQLGEDCSLQNPALLVALLAEYPVYGEELRQCVAKFLQNYHQNEESPQEPASGLLTPLNSEIVPLLEKYYELEKEREELIAREVMTDSRCTPNVRQTVCQLLTQTDNLTTASEETIASVRSRLHGLCDGDPEEALLGIKDFFGVTDFKEAVDQLQSGEWRSHRNWKGIFATERARGRQTSGGYMQPSHSHIPLFEETCRLLYRTHPDVLLTFVTFAQLARDYQALEDSAFARKCRKEFFYHRALLALPAFVSPDLTPVSPEALCVHSKLLLCSGYPNAEVTAVQLLLSNDMWEDAISLVDQTKHEDNHCALFHCLVSHLAKGGVLNQYIDDVWKLLPETFSVFDFLSLLKGLKTDDSQPTPILGSNTLTVSSVAPRVLDLLKQSKVV